MNDRFMLSGRTALITGGTRGIGRAISLEFARCGAKVIANYVRGQKTADTLAAEAKSEGLPLTICRADLTSTSGLETLETEVSALNQPLDIIVHCAATGVHKPFEELTLRHFDWTFALNVRAFFELTKRLLPRLSRSASIVALSSHGAERVVPGYTLVGASKGALEALVRHLAVELAPRGIRVNILSPGAVDTDVWDVMPEGRARLAEVSRLTPIGRLVTVEEVAVGARFLCSDAARSIIGQTLVIDGGKLLPV